MNARTKSRVPPKQRFKSFHVYGSKGGTASEHVGPQEYFVYEEFCDAGGGVLASVRCFPTMRDALIYEHKVRFVELRETCSKAELSPSEEGNPTIHDLKRTIADLLKRIERTGADKGVPFVSCVPDTQMWDFTDIGGYFGPFVKEFVKLNVDNEHQQEALQHINGVALTGQFNMAEALNTLLDTYASKSMHAHIEDGGE